MRRRLRTPGHNLQPVDAANIKALRMSARRIEDEEHDYGEGALVIFDLPED
ncbi:hypothetical protein ACJ8LH_08735 [Serratia sp. CY49633]|uniref:hypothetical protein n=1 Tax=Serratia TaxID=613 RepID=UPI000949BB1D|nr:MULTISPECIES: hypothetical protein [Serratia]MCS3411686.1 hypothetical protein [Serratia marcescens]MDU7470911.1 hypothetical protein [Serratia marcescens]WAY97081.1 hypothetical protein O3T13_00565 [Serratia marcescens]WRV71190.1 hypothetical protein VOT21_12240 [Serratia sp. K-M0252]CDJ77045.1 Hypothetical protein SMB2099_2431 [Serratia marcescens SMB2099]